ncbi:6-hydroxynicotinate 3-monooxygenase-like [Hibiscus syriacus]|uniref:6-hydroxynicotinate 3-monooxygenase-like n=1 Tax=Hibiscus syriacus TaxID=106335 RepID=A0A6A2WNQ4_HIBSY|nr:6-hydroxynicotinate 3-monooxygenase-like [Hibiscus syriacus]
MRGQGAKPLAGSKGGAHRGTAEIVLLGFSILKVFCIGTTIVPLPNHPADDVRSRQTKISSEQHPADDVRSRVAVDGFDRFQWRRDPYEVSVNASLAVINTHLCTAVSLLTWLLLDSVFFRKPSIIGAVQGMITGLVCITPAAGVVQGWPAIIMGFLAGSIPWSTIMVLHKRSKVLQKVDDTMAVLHTHAIAGSLGGILFGIFAVPKLNGLFYGAPDHYIGLFYGLADRRTRDVQVFVPLRMSEEEMEIGDEAAHGEEAYVIWGDEEERLDPKYVLPKIKAAGLVEMT